MNSKKKCRTCDAYCIEGEHYCTECLTKVFSKPKTKRLRLWAARKRRGIRIILWVTTIGLVLFGFFLPLFDAICIAFALGIVVGSVALDTTSDGLIDTEIGQLRITPVDDDNLPGYMKYFARRSAIDRAGEAYSWAPETLLLHLLALGILLLPWLIQGRSPLTMFLDFYWRVNAYLSSLYFASP